MKRPLSLLFAAALSASAAPHHTDALPDHLTLAQAEAIAMRQSPTVQAAQLKALASRQVVREVRSAFLPQITAEFSIVGTGDYFAKSLGSSPLTGQDTRIGASGGLNNPTILSRESNGILFNQLITDFGRTWDLTAASKSRALSEEQRSLLTRARVLLLVDQSYFAALQAQDLLRVANETVSSRQLFADQVGALAQGELRSQLDLSFARVSVDEARLLQLQAQNRIGTAFAELSTALGYPSPHRFSLAPVPPFHAPKGNLAALIAQALAVRPEALSLRHEVNAANRLASAEHAAHYPKVSLLGAAGDTPTGDPRVKGNYAAVGVNVEVPIFSGLRITARAQETRLEAAAAAQSLREMEDLIARDVQVALLNTTNASDKIAVAASLLANAGQAYELAEAKYKEGLTSTVEFGQAELGRLQAQINSSTAAYDYQIQRLILEFQIGGPRYLHGDPATARSALTGIVP